ncbi:MAG: hypothetical protein CMI53_02110 [Parcubacteria group bacterium]|nr:hypothetical protein [Parcubacteria group bacterium]|tara:strand:- start:5326 stop:6591 length:1266 start_codon:yes stop_codon:yes gene_type:complete
MPLNWKRILLVIGFILAVILFGYLLYFFFLKPVTPVTGPGPIVNTNVPPGGLPAAGVNVNIPTATNVNGALPSDLTTDLGPPPPVPPGVETASDVANGGLTKVTALTTSRSYQPTLAADGNNAIYYDKTTGLIYQINPSGKSTLLTDQVFFEVDNFTWSPNKQKAVLEYPDGSNVVYDFASKQQVTLPQHWKDFSFSPDSNELVLKSIGDSADSSWLAVTNSDGSNAKRLELLGDKDATVHTAWSPNNQIVAMYREDQDFNRQSLFFVGLNNENYKSTTVEGRGFSGQWSTQGDRLLYSVYSSETDYKPTMWIVAAQGESIGQNRRSLSLQTWSDKCTFSNNDIVYCAVPKSLSEGAGLFSDELDTSPTDIYKVDLQTGFKTKIAIPQGGHNIESLIVPSNQNYLYFQSKSDGRLYKIDLR